MTEPARPCPGCGSQDGRTLGSKNGFELRRCRHCRTLFTARLPGLQEAKDYSGYYHAENLRERPLVRRRLDQVVESFEGYRHLNRWLDVGCGAGTLMRSAAAAGWEVVGTEVAPGAASAVRAEGFDVQLGDLSELDLAEGGFDVVSMVEVLEHVPDPTAVLGRAARLLRLGGAMYLTTPHGRGISALALGSRWSVMAPPEHLQLFSVSGLESALQRSGLSTGQVRTHGLNPNELLAGLRGNALTPSERGRSSRQLNESLSASGRGRFTKRVANAVLDVSRLGDTLKAVAQRRG